MTQDEVEELCRVPEDSTLSEVLPGRLALLTDAELHNVLRITYQDMEANYQRRREIDRERATLSAEWVTRQNQVPSLERRYEITREALVKRVIAAGE